MDELMKELDALERLTSFVPPPGSRKTRSQHVTETLDTLLAGLEQAKTSLSEGAPPEQVMTGVLQRIEEGKRAWDERRKEGDNAYIKFGKTVDKVFPNGLPAMPNLFTSEGAKRALDRSVATHLIRKGDFEIAEAFAQESAIEIPPETSVHFRHLHSILSGLRNGDVQPALSWAAANHDFLESQGSPLEFLLHRSQYLRLLFAYDPPDPRIALEYARTNFTSIYSSHTTEIKSLLNAVLFLPLSNLLSSPYAELASDSLHAELEPLISKEFCARMGFPVEAPLNTIADVGGGSALAILETNRRKMAKARNEWSQSNELPVELPVPLRYRYHTVVCCPVVREPTTEANPPMLLTCGHVISKEAITRLQKNSPRVKCPYCPVESLATSALRLYF